MIQVLSNVHVIFFCAYWRIYSRHICPNIDSIFTHFKESKAIELWNTRKDGKYEPLPNPIKKLSWTKYTIVSSWLTGMFIQEINFVILLIAATQVWILLWLQHVPNCVEDETAHLISDMPTTTSGRNCHLHWRVIFSANQWTWFLCPLSDAFQWQLNTNYFLKVA